MDCTYCERNGMRRDGGSIGICRRCARKKCHDCGKLSAGKNLCTNCEYADILAAMQGRAKEPWFMEEDSRFNLKFREELLWEAQRMEIEGIKSISRGRLLSLHALWGNLGKEREDEIKPKPEIKEAA